MGSLKSCVVSSKASSGIGNIEGDCCELDFLMAAAADAGLGSAYAGAES
jgi:hypothetical protein